MAFQCSRLPARHNTSPAIALGSKCSEGDPALPIAFEGRAKGRSRRIGTTSTSHDSGGERKSRIMFIESKAEGLTGSARIGRVSSSMTGATLHYAERAFRSLKGRESKANDFDVETGEPD